MAGCMYRMYTVQKVSTLAFNIIPAVPVVKPASYAVGCSVLVGTSGLTVTTAFNRSSTTLISLATFRERLVAPSLAHLRSSLLANRLDLLELLLGRLLRVLLGLLVAAGLLIALSAPMHRIVIVP